MKTLLTKLFIGFPLIIFLSIFIIYPFGSLNAQNCSLLILDNRVVGNTHFLRSATTTMILRGDYSYSVEFFNDEKGVQARVTAKNAIELNQGDELIFADVNNNRKTYRFVNMSDLTGPKTYQNVLQLDMAAMQWFSENTVTTIHILSKATYEMRKFTLPDNRQAELKNITTCFNQTLDKSKVKNVTVSTETGGFKPSANPAVANPSVSGGNPSQAVRKADINQFNDQELAALRK